ncbi:uncharacterized [Tachysurus ichikawai]
MPQPSSRLELRSKLACVWFDGHVEDSSIQNCSVGAEEADYITKQALNKHAYLPSQWSFGIIPNTDLFLVLS